jgi:serine protease
VKWRDAGAGGLSKPAVAPAAAVQKLSAATGIRMKHVGDVSAGLDVVELEQPLQARDLTDVLATLEAQSDVEFVSPDVWRRPHRIPSDALFPQQWFLRDQQPSSTRAEVAWDATVGSTGTVVAILDTGARFDHPDVGAASQQGPGRSLPGYDFVSPDPGGTFLVANDENGRDPNPSDPGDWIDSADLQRSLFQQRDCTVTNSSWHGTRVSGLVAALTDNGIGVAGLGWNTWLLPVRVLGKCGGFDSDILVALRWAAGLSVSGVPDNPFPADVINMSLGSDGACTQATQNVINEVLAQGVVVIASAGNDGGPVDSPASCTGVIAVGALRHIGTKVGFSNVGQLDRHDGEPGHHARHRLELHGPAQLQRGHEFFRPHRRRRGRADALRECAPHTRSRRLAPPRLGPGVPGELRQPGLGRMSAAGADVPCPDRLQ